MSDFEKALRKVRQRQMTHEDRGPGDRRVRDALKSMEEMVVPQSPAELAMMFAAGPIGGKAFKGASMATGLLASDDAEAGLLPDFSDLTKIYRGIRYPKTIKRGLKLDDLGRPIDELGRLTMDYDKGVIEELASILPNYERKKGLFNTPLGATWWTENPRLIETYMNQSDSVAVPAYMKQAPDEVMDAWGRGFNEFFDKDERSGADFRKLLRNKNLKSIKVKNILDPDRHLLISLKNY